MTSQDFEELLHATLSTFHGNPQEYITFVYLFLVKLHKTSFAKYNSYCRSKENKNYKLQTNVFRHVSFIKKHINLQLIKQGWIHSLNLQGKLISFGLFYSKMVFTLLFKNFED